MIFKDHLDYYIKKVGAALNKFTVCILAGKLVLPYGAYAYEGSFFSPLSPPNRGFDWRCTYNQPVGSKQRKATAFCRISLDMEGFA
jgi:hypothetical protein